MNNYRLFESAYLAMNEVASGQADITHTTLEQAREVGEEKGGETFLAMKNFDKNFKLAQSIAKKGWMVRKDMPVIEKDDVKLLQHRLKNGSIDVKEPFSADTGKNPFPEGLTGEQAKKWLKNGLNDGARKDDIIKVTEKQVRVGSLAPIQKQIFVDNALDFIFTYGTKTVEGCIKFLSSTFYITSNDGYIIDGHHRFLAAALINPNMKVNTIAIDLPIETLLRLTVAYSDAIGNKRNK